MKAFLSSPLGQALKTWARTFVAAVLFAVLALRESGSFGYDMTTLFAVMDAALFALIPVLLVAVDPSDSRYGLGK